MPTNSALRTPKSRCPYRVSQPKVSHQVETNVVTRVERTPVTLREFDPAAPPRAAADDRQNPVLGRVVRASVHPTAGRIVGGGSLCLLLTAQDSGTEYPGKGRGTAPPPLEHTRRRRRAGHGQIKGRRGLSVSLTEFRAGSC